MAQTANTVFRDFVTDGVPSSGANKPKKPEIRALLTGFETSISAGLSNGGLIYDTKASMNADLAHPANSSAWVIGDAVAANNGIYRKSGASGSGSWTRIGDLPYSVVYAQNDDSGTANAVVATASAPVSATAYSQLISVPFTATNTGAMTIAINGETPRPLVLNTGGSIPSGYVSTGMSALVQIDSAGNYRMFSYGDASAIQAAAEAAAARAENAAASINLPPISTGDVGKALVVNADEDGYELKVPSTSISTRTALKSISQSDASITYLTEAGREGQFVFDSSDLSAKVTADTEEGIYIAPASDATGASGAWVRQFVGLVAPKWFGVTEGADAAADIDAAQAFGPLYFTSGEYRVETDLELTSSATFDEGAHLTVADGVTLTLSGEILAGAYKIFEVEGTGAIVASEASKLSKIEGMWFDNSFSNNTTTVRGVGAAHAAIGSTGLNGFGYSLVDGYRAAEDATVGLEATIIGTFAGAAGVDHSFNTLVGYSAGRGMEDPPSSGIFRSWDAQNCTVIGYGAMQNLITGANNVVMGGSASLSNEDPNAQVVIGASACRLGTVGKESVVIGSGAGYSLGTTGLAAANARSVHVGYIAAQAATESFCNTSVGALSANNVVTGVNNTHVGYLTGVDNASYPAVSRQISIGSSARSRADDTIAIGVSIVESTAGRIHIGGAANTSLLIAGLYDSTTATAANLNVDATGLVKRSTSSGEFKTAVEPLTDEWADKVLELQPVYYRSLCSGDNPDWGWYGLIAEDAAKVDPRFAMWGQKHVKDADGKPIPDEFGNPVLEDEMTPNGVPYDRLVVSLLAVVKRQDQKIADLVEKVAALSTAG